MKLASALQNTPKIILGIDPGTVVMGYGLIQVKGNQVEMLCMDVLKLSAKADAYEKLNSIYHCVSQIIETYKPTQFAIEAPFFGKNVQSMLKLGRAQGVAIAAAMAAGLKIHEYSPKKVKQSITGNGNADKQQLMKMLQQIFVFSENPKYLDASDALAVALCHHFQNDSLLQKNAATPKDWKSFIRQHPEKLK